MAEQFLTVKDVAQQLKCNPRSVYRAFHSGALKGTRLPEMNSIRFTQREVDRFVKAPSKKQKQH